MPNGSTSAWVMEAGQFVTPMYAGTLGLSCADGPGIGPKAADVLKSLAWPPFVMDCFGEPGNRLSVLVNQTSTPSAERVVGHMMNRKTKTKNRSYSFTRAEIIMLMAMTGVFASLVVASVQGVTNDASRTTFLTNIRAYVDAAQRFRLATNEYLPETESGAVPVGFETYIKPEGWVERTPIGGMWDVEFNTFGVTSALGVHFTGPGQQPDDAYMQEIDASLDDGDLTTGIFQKLAADRFYLIIAE